MPEAAARIALDHCCFVLACMPLMRWLHLSENRCSQLDLLDVNPLCTPMTPALFVLCNVKPKVWFTSLSSLVEVELCQIANSLIVCTVRQ